MLLSLVTIALMALMFFNMTFKAHFTKTRRMALIPLFCAITEMFTLGVLTPEFPVLTAISVLLRALILLSCWTELRRDELAYKKQVKRLQRQSAAKPAA